MIHVEFGIRGNERELRVYLGEVYFNRLDLIEHNYDVGTANIFSPVGKIGMLHIRDLTQEGKSIIWELKREKLVDEDYKRKEIRILDFKINNRPCKDIYRELKGDRLQRPRSLLD